MWGWVVGSEHIWNGCSQLQRRFRRVSRRHIECWLNKSLQSVLRTSMYSKEIKIIIITTYSILVLLCLVYKKNESWKWEFEGKTNRRETCVCTWRLEEQAKRQTVMKMNTTWILMFMMMKFVLWINPKTKTKTKLCVRAYDNPRKKNG